MSTVAKLKIRKGDEVLVTAGRDKGHKGEVTKVLPAEQRVFVRGANLVKRHQRPSAENPEGGVVTKEASLHVSNVMHIDPKDGKPTRVGYRVSKDGKKERFSKRSQEIIE